LRVASRLPVWSSPLRLRSRQQQRICNLADWSKSLLPAAATRAAAGLGVRTGVRAAEQAHPTT
jgi:hypothetical protein